MWIDSRLDEARLICPTCGAVGNGLATVDDGQPSYFCLTCLTRSPMPAAPGRAPNLLERLSRLGGRRR